MQLTCQRSVTGVVEIFWKHVLLGSGNYRESRGRKLRTIPVSFLKLVKHTDPWPLLKPTT